MIKTNILRPTEKRNHLLYLILCLLYTVIIFLFFLVSAKYVDVDSLNNGTLDIFTATYDYIVSNKNTDLLDFSYSKKSLALIKSTKDIHIIIYGIIIWMWIRPRQNEWKGMEHASGRFAGKYEMQKYIDPCGIPVADNVYIPIETHYYKPHFYSIPIKQISPSNLNQLVIAGSGGGKTLRELIAQIMACIGNYVVTDGKGELFKYTSKYMREQGYKTIALNFYDILFSHGFNPFNYIHSEQDVLDVSEMYIKATTNPDKQDYWTESAKLVFSTIMLYLYNTPDESKTIGRALDLVSTLAFSDKSGINMSSEYARVMTEYCADEEHYMDMVYIKWQDIQSVPAATLGGQISTLTTSLQLFYTKAVKNLTSRDEMNFERFNDPDKKTIIYVIIPPAKTTYKAITTLFFSLLFAELQHMANSSPTMCLPNLLNILMDEFINLGKINDMGTFTSVVRSYNIRLMFVIQNLQQLKKTYKDEYSTIISNCAIQTALGSIDDDKDETLQWLCHKLGGFNVRVETKSYNFGERGGGSNQNSIIKREYEPAELKEYFSKHSSEIYGGDCLVFIEGSHPLAVRKFDTLRNETYLNHIGYKKGSQVKNNTDIKEFFANHQSELEAERQKELQKHKERDMASKERYERNLALQEEEEQNALLEEFEKSMQTNNDSEKNLLLEKYAEKSIDSEILDKTQAVLDAPVESVIAIENDIIEDFDEEIGEKIDLDSLDFSDEDFEDFEESDEQAFLNKI